MTFKYALLLSVTIALVTLPALAADQTIPGAGNNAAVALSNQSPLAQSAFKALIKQTKGIQDQPLRQATNDILTNSTSCVTFRANLTDTDKTNIIQQLTTAGLVSTADDATFPGGLKAGIFPPLLSDGSICPKIPQTFASAPGSSFGGHHSYPGGLVVHEAVNEISDQNLGKVYRQIYGTVGIDGLPVVGNGQTPDIVISNDILIAAPIWHDWAKTIVFQWNSDGTEFAELNFGGNGLTDSYGLTGNSKTGGHHLMGLAEAMKRALAPDFVISQASAHSAPTLGNEYKVVNWLHTAAILAQIDPVAKGYLSVDGLGQLRLPALRQLGSINLNAAIPSQTNLLAEYALHNLSDADFTYSIPAISEVQVLLQILAPEYGYISTDVTTYNTRFRNPVLSYLSAERLLIIYSNSDLDGVRTQISLLRQYGVI